MKPIVNLYRLGRTPYIRALNIQHVLFENLKRVVSLPGDYIDTRLKDNISHSDILTKRIQSPLNVDKNSELADQAEMKQLDLPIANSLLLVEHEPVYTVGIRAQMYDHDYVSRLQAKLAQRNLEAEFFPTNRGGLITFHGPGQLVAYPIIQLGDFSSLNKSVKTYVERLELTIIDTLARVGVHGAHTVREYPGVWLAGGERKIAFIGVTCKRHVTMHGIAINCDCDLSWFDHIVSCGIEDKLITSVQRELLSIESPVGVGSTGVRNSAASTNQDGESVLSQDKQKPSPAHDTNDYSPKCSVQQIGDVFCSSFSRHFDCELLQR